MGELIKNHPTLMKKLAGDYLDKYMMYGHDEAQAWAKRFMTAEFRNELGPHIKNLAKDRGLRTT